MGERSRVEYVEEQTRLAKEKLATLLNSQDFRGMLRNTFSLVEKVESFDGWSSLNLVEFNSRAPHGRSKVTYNAVPFQNLFRNSAKHLRDYDILKGYEIVDYTNQEDVRASEERVMLSDPISNLEVYLRIKDPKMVGKIK